jgi:deazaflavin-dependent oxidoreductase (nitroreductase family)
MMDPSRPAFLKPTAGERFFNRLFGLFVGWGFGLSHNYLLEVVGRKTGHVYSTPVNIVDHYNGKRYLVAPRGETQWVRNARANGQLWLRKGRTRQEYKILPVQDSEKPELLKEYLDRYKTTVQRYFPIPAGSPAEAFVKTASTYPVFELIPK